MSESRPTLDQRRAQHTWETVERARALNDNAKNDNAKNDFAREAKRLPMRIKTAGLGQTLAFLTAKGGEARRLLLVQLGDWLLKKRKLAQWPQDAKEDNALVKAIINGDANLLRRATEETLLYLQWLTRFSEAELGTGEE